MTRFNWVIHKDGEGWTEGNRPKFIKGLIFLLKPL